ncbi:asparagine synthase (glutamine-hydrolyzing) [Mucilaginibacter sp. OK098]|uniref:asparagine synthase (glutamine-hydrolyzing) n=1 Tax=Mucilaginibacter sp. OK098 TaxID=1855297 RepID=UPI0009146AB8|nr:asparagine synthase (glutamine-hydrolyzing) [Mucilaginibacter sp. OK098]SHL93385.1 asparagine synthase (glutamine-hydrolysing) [Mucilaginibacter sp. OK098]
MCGIFGFINYSNQSNSHGSGALKKALDIVSYRGPDYSGYREFTSDIDNGSFLFLGHNRLSIIDLSDAGNQPFSIDNRYHIIFNGEIYNYLELRDELLKKGYVFKTHSDTEVLLNMYIDSGTSRFNELNGMWSFVIYDQVNNRVVASRDRFGVKPMYILEQDGTIFLASEIKQLLLFQHKQQANSQVLSHYLYNYLLDYNDETFFNGIKKLPAMHTMVIDLQTGQKTLEPYWEFTDIDFSHHGEQDIIDEYKTLLTSAVAIRLRSDVKVGNTLSGGLDSSSIAVLAHQLTGGNIYNYSVISNNKAVSEEKYVDYLVDHNAINVHKINFDQIDPWEAVDQVIWHHDEPILSLSTVAHFKMLESLKRESDIIVVLSGQGGDESLAGYNKYFFFNIKDLIAKGRYAEAFFEMAKLFPRMRYEFNWNFAKRYIPVLNRMKNNADVLNKILKIDKTYLNIGSAKDLKSRQKIDIQQYSVPALCHYEDRNSMAHSLEIRLPFLDYRLVNFSLNLPNNLKIKGAVNKQVLRRSMSELPQAVRYRFDKKGFTIDEKGHQDHRFFELLDKTFQQSALADLGYIDINKLRAESDKMRGGKSSLWERDLHRLLFAEIWAKKFL